MSVIGITNIALETFGGLLCLILALCLVVSRRQRERLDRLYVRLLLCNALVLFSDALAWIFKGGDNAISWWVVRIANFCVYSFGYLLLAAFTDYLVGYVMTKDKRASAWPARLMWVLALAAILLVILSQFNHMYYFIDERNVYHRQDWFWLSQAFGILCLIIDAGVLVRSRDSLSREELLPMTLCIALPVAALVIQVAVYGVALLYLATTISALGIYMSLQVEQARAFSEKELELEKSRNTLMLSQIQPHFLFNALEAIGELCRTDPPRAEQSVTDFSLFLRGNLCALTSEGAIPFSQERSHTAHYLELERVRYGPRLRVVWDVREEAFCLPPLTLQPIVENAVRHGVTKRAAGGTVTIRTERKGDGFHVVVSDDGVGFDPELEPETDGIHLGIPNVRARLAAQCGGILTIDSAPGRGTTVTIVIPQ